MINQRVIFAVAAAGICIGISGFVLYDTGLLGVQYIVTSGGGQVRSWDTAFATKASVMIFEGTVKSTEVKLVYEPPETQSLKEIKENIDSWNNFTGESVDYSEDLDKYPILPNGDFLTGPEKHIPYNYVTVQVTEWFKDSTGQYADQVVIRDDVTGAAGKIGGEPVWFEDTYAVGYFTGEKAIFFVDIIDGELDTDGAVQVFRYDENGRVYLPYFADLEEPFVADAFKAELRANL